MLRNDSWEANFVLANSEGLEIDVHSYTFDQKGKNIFGVKYLPNDLAGSGVIAGRKVKCIEAKSVLKFHSQYDPSEKDYLDVKALCEKFNIKLPTQYTRFEK